jgi:hypothetical protein
MARERILANRSAKRRNGQRCGPEMLMLRPWQITAPEERLLDFPRLGRE